MVAKMVVDWVEREFQGLEFGDKRLDYRLKLCISQAARMGQSTLDRARSKADLKATYRLVDNPKVSMDEILLKVKLQFDGFSSTHFRFKRSKISSRYSMDTATDSQWSCISKNSSAG